MKIKTLNQKSKIALFAVILVALIGLVLSVGSIVHAQEVGQVEPKAADTEAAQPADSTQEADATQAADATETAAQAADTAQSADTAQPAATSQQTTTLNDANSLLADQSEAQKQNTQYKVFFSIHPLVRPYAMPQDWQVDYTVSPPKIYKLYDEDTPFVSICSEWTKENFDPAATFYKLEPTTTDVLLHAETELTLHLVQYYDRFVKVTDANTGDPIAKADVVASYTGIPGVEPFKTKTGSNGEATFDWTSSIYWNLSIAADGYANAIFDSSQFDEESQVEIKLTPRASGQKVILFETYGPAYGMYSSFASSFRSSIADISGTSLKIVEIGPEGGKFKALQVGPDSPTYYYYPNLNGSASPTQCSYYYVDDNGDYIPMPESSTLTEDMTIAAFGFFNGLNQIGLYTTNNEFTYNFTHTLGDGSTIVEKYSDISFLTPQIDKDITFTVDPDNKNKLIGKNDKQNGTTVDTYEIEAVPKAGYVLSAWNVDGSEMGTEGFELTTNSGAFIKAVGEAGHTLTINYKYENGTKAADTHIEGVAEKAPYSVTSPTIEGYTPDIATVEGTMGNADITTDVTYKVNSGGDAPGGDTPGGGSDSAATSATGSSSTGDFNSSAVMAIMGLVALAGGFAITGRRKLFNK